MCLSSLGRILIGQSALYKGLAPVEYLLVLSAPQVDRLNQVLLRLRGQLLDCLTPAPAPLAPSTEPAQYRVRARHWQAPNLLRTGEFPRLPLYAPKPLLSDFFTSLKSRSTHGIAPPSSKYKLRRSRDPP
jgi:hypothetical protein